MADETANDLRWLLEPPEPGKVHLHLAVGEGAELSPEVKQAIEGLVRALAEPEVAGYAFDALGSCGRLRADDRGYQPCANHSVSDRAFSCKIAARFGTLR